MSLTTLCMIAGSCVLTRPPYSSSSSSSYISTKPVYSTSSVTWLMLRPVRSDMEMAKKWHKWRLIEIWNYVSNWYCWRPRHDSNVRPSVPQTVLAGIQGETATNKDYNINIIKALYCCHISPNMACFCKLMAQNWHKILPHTDHKNGVTRGIYLEGIWLWRIGGGGVI